ncbi:hypothetical protein D3C85_1907940 [compost metagenome]
MPWPGEQRLATVFLGQLLTADPLLSALSLTGQNQRLAVFPPTPQDRAATIPEQQHDRQVER